MGSITTDQLEIGADVEAQVSVRGSWIDPESLHIAVWLLCTFAFLYLLTASGRVRTIDEVLPMLQADSFLHHGTFAIPQAVAANVFYGKYDRFGQPQAPYSPGFTIAILPAYAIGQLLSRCLPGVPTPARDLVGDFFTTASNAAFAATAVALFFLALRRLRVSFRPALGASLLLGLATPLFAYSSWFFSEPLAAALLLGAALALIQWPEEGTLSSKQLILAGLLLGAAVWIRPAHIIAAPAFLAALIVRDGRRGERQAAIVGGIVLLFAAGYLARNYVLFSNPFDFGYPAAAEGGKRLNTFETPFSTGLFGLLFSPGKSILIFAPPVLLALYGLWKLWRFDRGAATVATFVPACYLIFYAKYTQWEGGYCFGPRYLVPVIPLLCLGLRPVLTEASRLIYKVAMSVGIAGLAVQLIGLATSFLEDEATGRYYDGAWNYRLNYNPLVSQAQTFWHYLLHPAAPIGRGFDRWFLLLAKAHVSKELLGIILAVEVAGLSIGAWGFLRSLKQASLNRV